jgi:hypothetical protein
MNVMLKGAALAMLAAAPAFAQSPPALSTNALVANALVANSLTAKAHSANSAGQLGRVVAVELRR